MRNYENRISNYPKPTVQIQSKFSLKREIFKGVYKQRGKSFLSLHRDCFAIIVDFAFPACHCGGEAELERAGPENYPWIENQISETIYCTI